MKATMKAISLLLALSILGSGNALARGTGSTLATAKATVELPANTAAGSTFSEYLALTLPVAADLSTKVGISVLANTTTVFSGSGLDFALYGTSVGGAQTLLSAIPGSYTHIPNSGSTTTSASYTGIAGYASYLLAVTGITKSAGGVSFLVNGSNVASITPVPEPESYAMLLAGLGLMGTIARRRNKAKVG